MDRVQREEILDYIFEAWFSCNLADAHKIKHVPGVYVISSSGSPIYVGSAEDINNRLHKCFNDHPVYGHYSYMVRHINDRQSKRQIIGIELDLCVYYCHYFGSKNGRYALEFFLIQHLKPLLNKPDKPLKKCRIGIKDRLMYLGF